MRAMRNRLVHAYFSVDPQIVWDTIYLYEAFAGRMQASPAQ